MRLETRSATCATDRLHTSVQSCFSPSSLAAVGGHLMGGETCAPMLGGGAAGARDGRLSRPYMSVFFSHELLDAAGASRGLLGGSPIGYRE